MDYEAMLERLMRLDSRACVRMRPTFSAGSGRWFVCTGSVVLGVLGQKGWASFLGDGATPEEAVRNTWAAVLAANGDPERFFLRYWCAPDEPIPGNRPQVWVRWNVEKDDWVDVTPTALSLMRRGIPADRIEPYQRGYTNERR